MVNAIRMTAEQVEAHNKRLLSAMKNNKTEPKKETPKTRMQALGRLKNGAMNKTEAQYAAHLETLKIQLPAVVSTDLRLNQPRYASLPNIMKAKNKQLNIIELDALGLSLKPHIEILNIRAPAVRNAGIKVGSVTELLDKLQHEAKVL